ncbi:MAG: hypothetical protein R6T96_05460 [Longimicrobiales bacterium]
MRSMDPASFQLGMINCFAEMVAAGVKRLALSPPLTPREYEELREASEAVVEGSGIRSYLEKSLLVTHLQTPEFTRGKWSVLYFRDEDVLREYLELKERKKRLEAKGALTHEAGREISRAFMKLLSYPDDVIEEKIRGGGSSDPFVLE